MNSVGQWLPLIPGQHWGVGREEWDDGDGGYLNDDVDTDYAGDDDDEIFDDNSLAVEYNDRYVDEHNYHDYDDNNEANDDYDDQYI